MEIPTDHAFELENATVIEGADVAEEEPIVSQSWGAPTSENTVLSYYTSSTTWSAANSVAGSAASSFSSFHGVMGPNNVIHSVPTSIAGSVPEAAMMYANRSYYSPAAAASPLTVRHQHQLQQQQMSHQAQQQDQAQQQLQLLQQQSQQPPPQQHAMGVAVTPQEQSNQLPIDTSEYTSTITHQQSLLDPNNAASEGVVFSDNYTDVTEHSEPVQRSTTPSTHTSHHTPHNLKKSVDFMTSHRASLDSIYSSSFSSVNSVSSRHPSSYIAQVERSRQHPQWGAVSAMASPLSYSVGSLGKSGGITPSAGYNNHISTQSQISQISQFGQHQPSSNQPFGKGSGSGVNTGIAVQGLGGNVVPQPRSQLSCLLAQSRRGSAQSLRHMPPQPPAEPVLEARKSVDYPWSHENTSSPPRLFSRETIFSDTLLSDLPRPPRAKMFHFANCSAAPVLRMITLVLDTIIKKNDKLYPSEQDVSPVSLGTPANEQGRMFQSIMLRFHGFNVPGIGLDAYFERILKYCPSTADVFISLLVYLDRIQAMGFELSQDKSKSLFLLDSYNVHRLVIAGMTVASKFFSDLFYKNSRYAKVGGLSVEELNNLELQFLHLLDFKLMISVEELQSYADFILNYQDVAMSSSGDSTATV